MDLLHLIGCNWRSSYNLIHVYPHFQAVGTKRNGLETSELYTDDIIAIVQATKDGWGLGTRLSTLFFTLLTYCLSANVCSTPTHTDTDCHNTEQPSCTEWVRDCPLLGYPAHCRQHCYQPHPLWPVSPPVPHGLYLCIPPVLQQVLQLLCRSPSEGCLW